MSLKGEENLWDQLWSNLKDKFGNNFQMKLPFSSYYWKDPAPGYIDYRTYDTFNERPAWSAVGTYDVTGTKTYEAYGSLIKFAPKLEASPAQQQQITDIESQINAANAQKVKDEAASFTAFRVAKQQAESIGLKVDPTLWFAENGWTKINNENKAMVDKLVKQKAAVLNQYPLNEEALRNFTPPEEPAATATDAGGKAFLKCFVGTDQFWKAIYNAPTPQTIINMMSKGGQQLTFNIDSSRSSSEMKKSWAGGNANSNDFFSIYAGGSWKKFDLTESGESVSLSVTFEKIDSFTVSKEGWYDGGYLANLKKKDEWAPGYNADKVFGKDGLLPLVTTNFIATIGMKLEVKVSQSSFEKHEEEFKAAGGVQIGPFRFGGGEGGSTKQQWERKAANSTFTITMTDEYPYVVGYMVARADGERL